MVRELSQTVKEKEVPFGKLMETLLSVLENPSSDMTPPFAVSLPSYNTYIEEALFSSITQVANCTM
jgi:hypothetical protein